MPAILFWFWDAKIDFSVKMIFLQPESVKFQKMKKCIILFVMTIMMSVSAVTGQTNAPKAIYDETADAMAAIKQATAQAKSQNKYVFCQVGGNWCPWCLRFADFAEKDTTVAKILHDNFVYVHVNWSRANKNPEAMRYLGNPARFGFPVFVILDEKGKPIHIQNSSYLEKDKGYDTQKVADFLRSWTPQAVNTLK